MSLRGIYPPCATPFDERGINISAFKDNLRKWKDTDLAGIVVLGSNGETSYLSQDEKMILVETAVNEFKPEKKIIVGTGLESTAHTVEFTKMVAGVGADAALVINPFYYRGNMNRKALYHHYLQVADSSPLPVLIYNVPKFTGINLDLELVVELSEHPNIVGMKDSSGDIARVAEIIAQTPDTFQVFAGTAGFLLPALLMGAAGGICALANIAPQECVDIMRYYEAGEIEKARENQARMIPVNKAVTSTYGVPGLKAALDMLGYYGGPPREPLLPLDDFQKETLKNILIENGLMG